MMNFGCDDTPILLIISLCIPLLLYPIQVMTSYVPADDFAVNCGIQGETKLHGRNWLGDINPKLFSTNQPSLTADAPTPTPPSVDAVPYATARIFLSQFTYSFPLTTSDPVFLRLHFYPATYHFPINSDTYTSPLFSVTAANFTLLKDFNASLWLLDDDKTFFLEYCINVEGSKRLLNITFIPSTSHHYAFINGIEVVSMPPFLYYTDTSNDAGFEQVSSSTTPYQLQSKRALQTLYRVNVAGSQVQQAMDTGMFRYWDTDLSRYLEKQYPHSIQSGYGLHLNYRNSTIPNYVAPEDVYLTARTYGMNATENYNVTWNFQVDSKFVYMVRLHFCEWDERIVQLADRRFQIFIADMMAEQTADVIEWSGGRLVPTYRDYAVFMLTQENSSTSKKVNLSIKLQRLREGYGTKISDVLMNGIEVFKISDDDNNLAGPNPDPRVELLQPPTITTPPSSKSSNSRITIIVIIVAVSSLIMLASSVIGIVLVILRRKQGMKGAEEEEEEERKKKVAGTEGQSSSSTLPSHLCRYFTIAEIRAATNNFDDVLIVGVGGFGNVYKGYIDDGSTPVAIKRLKPGSQQGIKEFLNEIEMLSQLRHLHLVSLIGYCNDGAEMILLYDFMQRGTLREYLYGSDNNKPLSWKQRLDILLGAARGLHYLHTGAKHNIIHRDVKSTNILLDDKWVAKVSDFGLSKVGPTGMSTTHVSTIVKGSLGYLDPEYYKRQRLTLKSDVYSFGVVLLEVLCGRPPLLRNVDKQRQSVVDWVRKCHEEGKLDRTVDPSLKDSITPDVLKWYGQMALSCLREDGNQRPSMGDVVGALEFGMQLVESEEEESSSVGFGGTQGVGKSEERPLLPQYPSEEEGSMLFTSTSDESGSKNTTVSASSEDQAMPSALVFSEIGDPKAR